MWKIELTYETDDYKIEVVLKIEAWVLHLKTCLGATDGVLN